MSLTYFKELSKLSSTKRIISLLPERLRFRVAKSLYNYESADIHGIDLVAPLLGDGLVCSINTKDIIGWKIFFFGQYEQDTNEVLNKYIKKGDVVLEAGANMGSETLLISRLVGSEGHVYGFEPNPYTFERLQTNININELKNVSIYDLALGESNTTIHFNIYPRDFCNPGMSSKYMETSITKKISVQQETIDSFMKAHNVPKLDFLKMDIQGAEMDALNGAKETLAKYKPTIFSEAFTEFNHTQQMYDLFKGLGYNVYKIEDNNNLTPLTSGPKDGNWLVKTDK